MSESRSSARVIRDLRDPLARELVADILAKLRGGFLAEREAAAYLAISEKTLKRLRYEGRAPVHRWHLSRAVYEISALDAWSVAQPLRDTRAERGGA